MMQAKPQPSISENLRQRLKVARSVFVLTGAGVSAESGVPTFRGGGGTAVWKGLPVEVISSSAMLKQDLTVVWEWFDYRCGVVGRVEPNAAHRALAGWQNVFEEFTLVTQNVDGLHSLAGSPDVVELHGNIWRARCERCGMCRDLRDDSESNKKRPPVCDGCGGQMRPGVVLFGEMLSAGVFEQAAARAQRCDVCFVIGTSGVVYPAAALPEIAAAADAFVVEINPERTPLSDFCNEVIQGQAGQILPLF